MQYHLQFFLAPNQTIILFVVRAYIKAVNVPNSNFLFSFIQSNPRWFSFYKSQKRGHTTNPW
jgi:hypothetical protein